MKMGTLRSTIINAGMRILKILGTSQNLIISTYANPKSKEFNKRIESRKFSMDKEEFLYQPQQSPTHWNDDPWLRVIFSTFPIDKVIFFIFPRRNWLLNMEDSYSNTDSLCISLLRIIALLIYSKCLVLFMIKKEGYVKVQIKMYKVCPRLEVIAWRTLPPPHHSYHINHDHPVHLDHTSYLFTLSSNGAYITIKPVIRVEFLISVCPLLVYVPKGF